MLASVASRYIRHTLGAKVGGLAASSPELEIINGASAALTRMRSWNFLLQRTAPLSLRRGEPLITLPDDFNEAVSLEATLGTARLSWMELVSPKVLVELRSETIVNAFTYFACVVDKPITARNLLQRTEEFSAAIWQNVGITVTQNTTSAPSGTLTGDTLSASATTSVIRQRVSRSILRDTQTYGWSVYMKQGTATAVDVELAQHGTGITPETSARSPRVRARVTWATGVASIAVTSSVGAESVATVEDVGDGWYRVFLSLVTNFDQSIPNAEVSGSIYPSPVSGTATVIAWGAQMELIEVAGPDQDPYPSRYEPVAGDTNIVVPRTRRALEIWPTPQTDKLQAFRIFYRARVAPITNAETSEIVIPEWIDDFYIELCRIYARGYQEEDDGMLHERLQSLKNSDMFFDVVEQDDGQQFELGPLGGCAADYGKGSVRNWNTGPVPSPE